MSTINFRKAFSHSRFARYFAACNNDFRRAMQLYWANIALSQQMYGIFGVFEVIFRNAIDNHYSTIKGNEWLAQAVSENGFLTRSPGCEFASACVHKAIHKLGTEYTHDRLIAKMSFGFWAYQFAKREYAAGGSTLINIFFNRSFGTKQKEVAKNLLKVGELRNRIAHYESICFIHKTSIISTEAIKNCYELISQMLRWLGFDPKELLHEIDHVNEAIQAIENLKENRLKRFIDFILANPIRTYEGFPENFSNYQSTN